MNFIEYLAELQLKYDIPNAEILEEMQLQGLKISKSNLSHKLSGERQIPEREFELMVHTIRPTAAEEKKLRRLYTIRRFGEKEYAEVERIRDYIAQFADDTTVYFSDFGAALDAIIDIHDEKTLTAVLFRLLSEVWGKDTIRICCQPDFKPLIDMMMFLSRSGQADVEHLVCLNNDYKRDSNVYNIQCLKVLDKLVIRNMQHKIRYFYDMVYSRANSFNLFPFFILAGNRALLINWDCKSGYLVQRSVLVHRLGTEFKRMYDQAESLFGVVSNDVEYMRMCMEMEAEVHQEQFILQYHPCLAFNCNEELTRRCMHEAYPEKEQMMAMFRRRWNSKPGAHSIHLYTREGKEEFLRTGMTSDMDPHIFRPLDEEERRSILASMSCNPVHTAVELNDTFVKVPAQLALFCADSGRILISYNNGSASRLIMQERSMHRSMVQFFRYVLKYEVSPYSE